MAKEINIQPSQELRFSFVGDKFAIRFAKLNVDPAGTFDVVVDGVPVSEDISHYQSPAAFGFSELVEVDFGRHDVRIINNSTSIALRLEAIEHYRSVEVLNQGLIGTASGQWLSGGALLSGAVPAGATHAMIMLGTNDRSATSSPRQPSKVADNVESIVTWLLANREGIQPVVYSPPIARANSEQGGSATYYFTASEVSRALGAMCARKGFAFVDFNAELKAGDLAGTDPLASDDLHLGDAGHLARFRLDARLLTAG
ncbi:hypothetical protein ASE63_08225 [Bosea sp. Root381]|nr:hypothetical protein ASE63_08225 [Bosea sp. Root381]